MMTVIFVFTLVPNFALADAAEGAVETTLELLNPVRTFDTGIADYSSYLRGGTAAIHQKVYRAYFQLDFSGYEHLLRDDSTKIQLYVRPGGSAKKYPLYAYNMYILDDASDEYGEHYKVYSDSSYGMSREEVLQYVTYISNETGKTPFITSDNIPSSGTYSTEISNVSSDANMQVLLDALEEAPDNSVVTLQYVTQTGQGGGNGQFKHKSDLTYLKITCSNSEATPQKYAQDIADMITWDSISSDDINNVTSSLNLLSGNYLGTTIDWESNNETAINPETGAVTVDPEANTYVTLTANVSYTPYEGEAVTAKQVFNVKIPKNLYDYSSGTGTYYTGDNAFKSTYGGDRSHTPKITKVGGIAGKDINDLCYMLQDSNGGEVDGVTYSANRRYNMIDSDDSPGYPYRDIYEFDICIPDDCYGYRLMIKYKDFGGNGGTYGGEFAFKSDGIYETRFGKLIFPWDGNEWHHVAIVAPGVVESDADGVEYDTYVRIYVDGVLEFDDDLEASYSKPNGISYCQANGLCPITDHIVNNKKEDGTHDVNGTNWTTVACYLDNVRYTNDDLEDIIIPYNTLSNVASSSYGVDNIAETLTVVGTATVQEILDSLTVDEDATPRVYSDGTLIEDTSVAANDNMTIVVADTNGTRTERTYAYYDIRVISDGEYAFDIPYITFADNKVTGTVKLFNNTASPKTYKLYIAVYNDDKELIEVIPASLTAESGETKAITTNAVSYEGAANAKLFIWEEDGIKPALANVLYE